MSSEKSIDSSATVSNVPRSVSNRKQTAHAIVRRHSGYSAVAGLIPLPVLDAFALTGVQVKMISELAELYELSFSRHSVKAIVTAVIGGILPVSPLGGVALGAARYVPVVGPLLGIAVIPAFASGLTWAVGRGFTAHFEDGGDFSNIDLSAMKDQVRRGLGKAPVPAATSSGSTSSAA